MNGDYLLTAMGGISPSYVEEAEKERFAKPRWRTLLPLAACLAVIIGMYAGLQALMVSPMPGANPAELPAAQTAEEYFRTAPLLNWGSLLLGLASWGLPLAGFFRREYRKALTFSSFIACILSLLLQVCSVLHWVNKEDFTTLADTMCFVMLAAVVLVAGTVVVNLAVFMKKK